MHDECLECCKKLGAAHKHSIPLQWEAKGEQYNESPSLERKDAFCWMT